MIDPDVALKAAALLRERPKARRTLLFTSGGVLVAVTIFWLVALSRVIPTLYAFSEFFIPAFLIPGVLFLTAALAYLPGQDSELGPIRKERERIQERIEKENRVGVLDTIQLSLNQLTEYYTINKGQARRSFNFSVVAISLGLLTLIGGIWLFYFSSNRNTQLATLSSISGLFIQFIGGANFYIYNKSISQLNMFYAELVRTQNTMLAIELADQIAPERRDIVKERLIDRIMMICLLYTSHWLTFNLSRKEGDASAALGRQQSARSEVGGDRRTLRTLSLARAGSGTSHGAVAGALWAVVASRRVPAAGPLRTDRRFQTLGRGTRTGADPASVGAAHGGR